MLEKKKNKQTLIYIIVKYYYIWLFCIKNIFQYSRRNFIKKRQFFKENLCGMSKEKEKKREIPQKVKFVIYMDKMYHNLDQ